MSEELKIVSLVTESTNVDTKCQDSECSRTVEPAIAPLLKSTSLPDPDLSANSDRYKCFSLETCRFVKLERLREEFYLHFQTLHLWNLFTPGPYPTPWHTELSVFLPLPCHFITRAPGPSSQKLPDPWLPEEFLEFHIFLASTANMPFIPARVSLGSLLSSTTLHILHVSLSPPHRISVTQLPFQEQYLLPRNAIHVMTHYTSTSYLPYWICCCCCCKRTSNREK